MHSRFSIQVIVALFFFSLPTIVFADVQGTLDFTNVYYHVEGQKSMSFYPTNDVSYLHEAEIDFSQEAFGDYEAFGNILYRFTDDRIIDLKRWSFERINLGLSKEAQEILVGDFYSSFSENSLDNALKGTKISLGNEKSSRLFLVAGIDTTRWEDIWGTRREDSAGRKYVWGARMENSLKDGKAKLNFNYGAARDDTAYVSSFYNPTLVNVLSADGEYIFNDYLTAIAEFAQSFIDEDTGSSQIKTKSDTSKKIVLELDFADYTMNWLYSRIGNHFMTTGGFLTQGLETINLDGTWFLPWRIKCNHYLYTDRDNISDTDWTSTKQINPGVKFSMDLPLEISWEIGSDVRKRYSSDKNVNERTNTYTTNIARDFGIIYSTFGYTRTIVRNRVSPEQERTSDAYSLALDGTFTIKDISYSWNIEEFISHDDYRQDDKADLLLSTIAGLKVRFPSSLSFEAKMTIGDNNYYINENDSYKTSYYFSVSRQLRDDLDLLFTYGRRSYNYLHGDDNYAETIIDGKLSYQF